VNVRQVAVVKWQKSRNPVQSRAVDLAGGRETQSRSGGGAERKIYREHLQRSRPKFQCSAGDSRMKFKPRVKFQERDPKREKDSR